MISAQDLNHLRIKKKLEKPLSLRQKDSLMSLPKNIYLPLASTSLLTTIPAFFPPAICRLSFLRGVVLVPPFVFPLELLSKLESTWILFRSIFSVVEFAVFFLGVITIRSITIYNVKSNLVNLVCKSSRNIMHNENINAGKLPALFGSIFASCVSRTFLQKNIIIIL